MTPEEWRKQFGGNLKEVRDCITTLVIDVAAMNIHQGHLVKSVTTLQEDFKSHVVDDTNNFKDLTTKVNTNVTFRTWLARAGWVIFAGAVGVLARMYG